MRIAQVAPLHESVPPKLYGGTERVVSYLTETLVDMGHEVTLFASGDSETRATLRPVVPQALRLGGRCLDAVARHVLLAEQVFAGAEAFDLVHFHIDYVHFPLVRRMRTPHVTTLHGRLDIPDLEPLYREFEDVPLVSISDAQREPLSWANWQATVHHGLPAARFPVCEAPGRYLAFLGRLSPEKGVDRAVEIAARAGLPLKIAAKIDDIDREYFETVARPLLARPGVEFVGEIGEADKGRFLGEALALLFPIAWPEPFGLVMIEAMACGTPVVAFAAGSVSEVIDEGVTGCTCRSVDEAVACVERVGHLSRRRVREVFETRFSAERMARDYLRVYQRLTEESRDGSRRSHPRRRPLLHPRDVAPGRRPDPGSQVG
jgi:glycosyltransferase involved in cell wall biosynthesis